MNQTLDRFVSLLFPKGCVLCGDAVAYDDLVCRHCKPDRMDGELCVECGKPMAHCVCRLDHAWSFDRAVSALHYRRGTRGALLRLKKTPNPRIAAFFASEMKEVLAWAMPGAAFDLATEVPMHPEKLAARGFNQAELLAAETARILGIPHRMRLLACGGEIIAQHNLTREERFLAAADRYRLDIPRVEGKRILLVDDIMTTGATLDECARCLKRGGAAEVVALTAAGTAREAKQQS